MAEVQDYDYPDIDSDDMEEKYSSVTKKTKSHHSNKPNKCNGNGPRKNSLTKSISKGKLSTLAVNPQVTTLEQPSVDKTSEFHSVDVSSTKKKADSGLRKGSQSSQEEIDDELANLVKEMTLTSKNVLYYGWFFSQTISESLKKLSETFFKECLEIKQFQRWVENNCAIKDVTDPLEYYQKSRKRQTSKVFHVTAKFCDNVPCQSYTEKIQGILGSEFKLAIIGLYFTDRSFGLRVKLNQEQFDLFDDERKVSHSSIALNTSPAAEPETAPIAIPSTKPVLKHSHSIEDTKTVKHHHSKEYPGISFVPQRENFQPTESRAHVTIGCAPGVKAFRAGEDLVDIIDLEKRSILFHDYKIPGGILRQFGRHGEYTFVVYPQNRVLARAVFMPFA